MFKRGVYLGRADSLCVTFCVHIAGMPYAKPPSLSFEFFPLVKLSGTRAHTLPGQSRVRSSRVRQTPAVQATESHLGTAGSLCRGVLLPLNSFTHLCTKQQGDRIQLGRRTRSFISSFTDITALQNTVLI